MLYPSINELLKKVDSRYTLVVEVSKRARELVDGDDRLVIVREEKPVSIATHEVYNDKIKYVRDAIYEDWNEEKEEVK